jgi:hypothetical protein
MRKETHTVQRAIEPFVQEDNIPVVMEMLYPMLSNNGKKEVKQYWKETGYELTPEAFEIICNAAKEVTGIDIRNVTKRNKLTSLTQFLISFALYHEFVVCKKATLKNICETYMPSIKHSQIIYAVKAIEKNIHEESVFNVLYKFVLAIESAGFGNSNRRVITLRAGMKNTNALTLNEVKQN